MESRYRGGPRTELGAQHQEVRETGSLQQGKLKELPVRSGERREVSGHKMRKGFRGQLSWALGNAEERVGGGQRTGLWGGERGQDCDGVGGVWGGDSGEETGRDGEAAGKDLLQMGTEGGTEAEKAKRHTFLSSGWEVRV